MKQTLLKLVLALLVTMPAVGPVAASEREDVMKVVHQWVDSLNKDDTNTAIAACGPQTTIIDEFPPHEWHGEGACSKWVTELDAYNKRIGLTDSMVTLKKARRIDVEADRAYVVVPADFHFKQNGKDGQELGALFTVALQKGQAGWRIAGWAWSRP